MSVCHAFTLAQASACVCSCVFRFYSGERSSQLHWAAQCWLKGAKKLFTTLVRRRSRSACLPGCCCDCLCVCLSVRLSVWLLLFSLLPLLLLLPSASSGVVVHKAANQQQSLQSFNNDYEQSRAHTGVHQLSTQQSTTTRSRFANRPILPHQAANHHRLASSFQPDSCNLTSPTPWIYHRNNRHTHTHVEQVWS